MSKKCNVAKNPMALASTGKYDGGSDQAASVSREPLEQDMPSLSELTGPRSLARSLDHSQEPRRSRWSYATQSTAATSASYVDQAILAPMTKFVVAILLALMTAANAAENLLSANAYMPGCRDFVTDNWATGQRNAYQRGKCIGFIAGLVYEASATSVCMPRGVKYEQGVRVVIRYIEARPERMHESFGKLALEALEEAWPCKAQ